MCNVFSLEGVFLHIMLPLLLSFKACTIKPAHPKGHYTVWGTVVFDAIIVNGSRDISVSAVTSPWVGWLRSKVWFLRRVKSCTVLQIVHTVSGGPLILHPCGFQCLFPSGKASGIWNWPLAFCTSFNARHSSSLSFKYFLLSLKKTVPFRLSDVVPVAAAPLTLVRLERWIYRKPLYEGSP